VPRALCLIRDLPHYRRDAFVSGLRAAGFDVRQGLFNPQPGDCVVMWNRYSGNDEIGSRFEAAGASVLVAENGYLPLRDDQGRQHYAISLSQHHHGGNTAGASALRRTPPFSPWREKGDHILICAQRGFGSRVMQCKGWADRISVELRGRTKRPIRLRRHPGNQPPEVPLERDLDGCHAVVIWSSNAGIGALLAGVPVFYGAPKWIASEAALPLAGADLEKPFLGDRTAGLANALANQWSIDEIASGEAFRALGL
jgi:hypothetical protein